MRYAVGSLERSEAMAAPVMQAAVADVTVIFQELFYPFFFFWMYPSKLEISIQGSDSMQNLGTSGCNIFLLPHCKDLAP
jgi:hypothetical protein